MRTFLIFLAMFAGLTQSPISLGAKGDPDLVSAKQLFRGKEYLSALRILAPCLKAELPNRYSNLEDCLFLGEEVMEGATRGMGMEYEQQPPSVQFENWSGAVPYRELGLDIHFGHYGGVIYNHEFFRKLKQLFPKSKYREIYEYSLIQRGENEIADVNRWLKELETYRRNFPSGRYYLQATAEMAHGYDNLWDILRPESQTDYYEWFSSGNRKQDAEQAEAYREKALALYKEIIQKGDGGDSRLSEIVGRVKERYPGLVARKEWSTFYILND